MCGEEAKASGQAQNKMENNKQNKHDKLVWDGTKCKSRSTQTVCLFSLNCFLPYFTLSSEHYSLAAVAVDQQVAGTQGS